MSSWHAQCVTKLFFMGRESDVLYWINFLILFFINWKNCKAKQPKIYTVEKN